MVSTAVRTVSRNGPDVCPYCRLQLGKPRGRTRRLIVLTAAQGVFRWQCPDCKGVWDTQVAGTVGELL